MGKTAMSTGCKLAYSNLHTDIIMDMKRIELRALQLVRTVSRTELLTHWCVPAK